MYACRLVALSLLLSSAASGVVVTLGTSNQPFMLTGTGPTITGSGTTRPTFGTCNYDGKNTTCILSGPFTGIGTGGTWAFTFIYPGNGLAPLGTVSAPGSDLFTLTTLTVPGSSFAFTLTPNGGSPVPFYDLTGSIFFSPTTAVCAGVSGGCGVGAVGQTVGGTITGPVSGSFDTTPFINAGGVVTATDYGGYSTISPATFIEIYGINLSTAAYAPKLDWGSSFNGSQAPTSLGGTTATVAGIPAYVQLSNPHQVNVLVPSNVPTGPQKVVLTTYGGSSVGTTVNVNPSAPGILAPAAFHLAAGQYAVAVFPDNKTYVLPPTVNAGVPTARAKPGNVIIMYGLGFGPVSPVLNAGTLVSQTNTLLPNFTCAFAGTAATVQFAGLVQGYTGLYQFNVVIPNIAANDATPFTYTINGTAGTQALILPIGN